MNSFGFSTLIAQAQQMPPAEVSAAASTNTTSPTLPDVAKPAATQQPQPQTSEGNSISATPTPATPLPETTPVPPLTVPESTVVPGAPAMPLDSNTPGTDANNPAVQDITGKPPSWLSSIFDKGSPVHLQLDLSETYDDNIFIQPNKVSDYITNISPSASIELGDKTSADANYLYGIITPTFLLYADNSSQDVFDDYFADVHFQHQFTRLTLGIEQTAAKQTSTNIDVGARVNSDVYTTVGTATYDYNTDLSLAGSVTQNITNYDNSTYINTTERVGDFYALYQVGPKLRLGLGPRIGAVDVQGGPDQIYQDGLVHLIYDATGKITVTLIGGGEEREYDGNNPNTFTPIYEVRVDGQPTDSTTLTFDSNRHRVVSFGTMNEDYISTDFEASVRQRFLQNAYATLGGGYAINDYVQSNSGAPDSDRHDNYAYVKAGAEWKPRDWLDVSVYYQYSRDDSNQDNFTFNDNQVTAKATLTY